MFVVWWLSWNNRNYYGASSRSWYGHRALRDGQYRCLLCGASSSPGGGLSSRALYDAQSTAALHLRRPMAPCWSILHRNPGCWAVRGSVWESARTGSAEGCTDKEIAAQEEGFPPPPCAPHSSSGKRQPADSFGLMGTPAHQPHLQPGGYWSCHPHPTAFHG